MTAVTSFSKLCI